MLYRWRAALQVPLASAGKSSLLAPKAAAWSPKRGCNSRHPSLLQTPPLFTVTSLPMAERTIGITLLGCGVVGTGVARILTEQRDLIARRTGLVFDLRHVVVRDPSKVRTAGKLPVHTDANAAINDPQVHVVVELIGGTTVAAELLRKTLALGKPVVTANKSLLAAQGRELFAL